MLFKVIVSIAILGLIIINILYRLQIKDIYKQIDFININETNKIITPNIQFEETTMLINELNKLIQIHRDITINHKIKEEELKQAITNISHDIRTPLTSLNGYFQLLVESNSKEERDRYISIIQTRINILKDLLEDTFTYMKIQEGTYRLEKEELNINRIIHENLLSYYEDFKAKGIEPSINMPKKPIIIKGNLIGLNRIISNLINNSLIHGKSYIGISLYAEENNVKLIVENDVDQEEPIDIEDIFSRFYKKDKARTSNSTGLGLTIAKELVEAMDGKIVANQNNNIFSIEISLIK